MGNIFGEIWGEDFSTCQEGTKKIGANFGENFGNLVSNFATLFRNFVQKKGGANDFLTLRGFRDP